MRLLLLISILLFSSCAQGKKLSESSRETRVIKDSTFVVETTKVDTVRIPGDTIIITVFKEDLKPGLNINESKGRAKASISFDGETLRFISQCDSLEKLILTQQKIIERYRDELSQENYSKEQVTDRPIPWYYKAGFWIAFVFIGLMVLGVVVKVLKK